MFDASKRPQTVLQDVVTAPIPPADEEPDTTTRSFLTA
jgi:hypothetical protein